MTARHATSISRSTRVSSLAEAASGCRTVGEGRDGERVDRLSMGSLANVVTTPSARQGEGNETTLVRTLNTIGRSGMEISREDA